jgi:uncharacterized membrane protein YqaE (UPF0057 family)
MLPALSQATRMHPEEYDNPSLTLALAELGFSFVFPPLAVLLKRGLSLSFLASFPLTFLGWVPGKYSTTK